MECGGAWAVPRVLWRNGSGLGGEGSGRPNGAGWSCPVPWTVELEPFSPRPRSLGAFSSGTANPAEPQVWRGALWPSPARWERAAPGASRRSRAGGLRALLQLARRTARHVPQESVGFLSV